MKTLNIYFIKTSFVLAVLSVCAEISLASGEEDSLTTSGSYKNRFFSLSNRSLKEEGGWVSPKGTGFFKLGQNIISSGDFFNPNGEVIKITTTALYITSLYGEYGLSDRLTAVAYIPFFVRQTLNEVRFEPSGNVIPGDELNSFGDVNLGVKYGIRSNKSLVVNVGLTLGIPTGNDAGGTTRLLQSGDGEFNQLLTLEAGYSIPKTNIFLSALVGVNNRTRGFSEEFHYGLEAGITFMKNFTAIMKIRAVESFFNGEAPNTQNGIFSNNTEYFSYTPELIYTIKDTFGLVASAGFALSGKNILASPNWSFGLFYKLKKK